MIDKDYFIKQHDYYMEKQNAAEIMHLVQAIEADGHPQSLGIFKDLSKAEAFYEEMLKLDPDDTCLIYIDDVIVRG